MSRGVRALLCALVLFSCGRKQETPQKEPEAQASAGPAMLPVLPSDQLRMVKTGKDADVAALIKAEVERENAQGRKVLVYVGATWCEPCQRFHQAANQGKLDQAFPKLTILEFDADEDGSRLRRAGYVSKYIPLFVVPGADGRASSRSTEGGVKGEGAVANLIPKLRGLLQDPP
jgi:thiol-disulfide isomerase/thioredoxin